MKLSLLSALTTFFAIKSPRRLNRRCLSILRCMYVLVIFVGFCGCICYTLSAGHGFMERLSRLPYIYHSLHVGIIYVWVCRNTASVQPPRNQILRRMDKHLFVQLFYIIFTTALGWWAVVKYDLAHVNPALVRACIAFAVIFGHSLSIQSLIAVIYAQTAVEMHSVACDIDDLLEQFGASSAEAICLRTTRRCTALSRRLSKIVWLAHVEYFVRLVIEVPVQLAAPGFQIFVGLQVCAHLHVFLLLVAGGNAVHRSAMKLRRLVLREVGMRSEIVRVYLGSQQGVIVGSSPLSWTMCCSFLGVSWSFAFMVFEIFMSR